MIIEDENERIEDLQSQINKLSDKIDHLKEPKQQSRSPQINELAAALSKAQGEMEVASTDSTNPFFKSKYADLTSIVSASRKYLAKYGLSVTQPIVPNEDGSLILHTILLHSSGQFMESRMRIIPPKNDVQSLGSTISYLRRYAYASLVGVVTGDEDDDGERAMAESRKGLVKGPPIIAYNPKDQSPDVITKEQLEELEYELTEYPDIGEMVLERLHLQSLADMPKSKFMASVQRIREIKLLRSGK